MHWKWNAQLFEVLHTISIALVAAIWNYYKLTRRYFSFGNVAQGGSIFFLHFAWLHFECVCGKIRCWTASQLAKTFRKCLWNFLWFWSHYWRHECDTGTVSVASKTRISMWVYEFKHTLRHNTQARENRRTSLINCGMKWKFQHSFRKWFNSDKLRLFGALKINLRGLTFWYKVMP